MKKLMGDEKKLLPMALLYSAISGCALPVNGFLLAKIIALLSIYVNFNALHIENELINETRTKLYIYIIGYFLLAIVSWFVTKNQQSLLNEIGVRFTTNLRKALF